MAAVDEVLQRKQDAGGAAHDEDGGAPRAPGDGDEEGEQAAHGDEEAERREAAGEAEEQVRVVDVERAPLCACGRRCQTIAGQGERR